MTEILGYKQNQLNAHYKISRLVSSHDLTCFTVSLCYALDQMINCCIFLPLNNHLIK